MQNRNNRTIRIPLTKIRGKGPADVARALLTELCETPESDLPLQPACQQGGWADTKGLEVALIDSHSDAETVTAWVAVYFSEVVGGCNCNDDPVAHPAYARLRVVTRLSDGETTIDLADND